MSATDPTKDRRPLDGVSVLITRTAEQARALAEPLAELGAEVLAFPVIEVADPVDSGALDTALRALGTYDWVVLTSTNGVDRFFERLDVLGIPARVVEGVRLAVVGSSTAKRLAAHGRTPDLMPADFRAEGLIEAFREIGVAGSRILIPRAAEAREVLPAQLTAMGATVDAVDLYRLVSTTPDPGVLARLADDDVDVVTFASGATARHFMELLAANGLDANAVLSRVTVASVGPVTTEGLAKLGITPQIEACESTMESLVEAIAEYHRR